MINLRVTNIIFQYISAVTCFALVCLLHAAISYRRMAVWHISVVSVTAVADTDTVLQVAVRRAIITRIRVRIRIGIFPSATAASIRITAENVCSGYRTSRQSRRTDKIRRIRLITFYRSLFRRQTEKAAIRAVGNFFQTFRALIRPIPCQHLISRTVLADNRNADRIISAFVNALKRVTAFQQSFNFLCIILPCKFIKRPGDADISAGSFCYADYPADKRRSQQDNFSFYFHIFNHKQNIQQRLHILFWLLF